MATISTSTPLHSLRTIAVDIKLAHSVFALPFALLAAVPPAMTSVRFAGSRLLR